MPLPRYARRPMRAQGAGTIRKRPVRRVVYLAVAKRARGICEIPECGARQDPLDPHHTFRRGHLGGIPDTYCESAELVLGVCRPCHDDIHDGDQEKADKARLLALSRFTERWELELGELMEEAGPDLVDVMRAGIRRLEERTGA